MATPDAAPREGLIAQIQDLDNRFWIVNIMEMFERLAYYGVRAVISIYMVLAVELGGPEFDHIQKANIYFAWAGVQSLLPAWTGGLADRYGHKRTIVLAIILKIIGYVMMAEFTDYGLFFAGCMFLAGGTAIFKPGVQGTLASALKKGNASVGWGIFYQLVNVGGFMGPVLAGFLRLMDWRYVFYACAVIVSINFLWLPFYRDPTQDHAPGPEADARQRATWANVSQSITAKLAANWAAIFAFCNLVWFGVALLWGGLLSAAPDEAAGWVSMAILPIGCVGVLLSGGALATTQVASLRRHAWLPQVLLFVLAMGAVIAGVGTVGEERLAAAGLQAPLIVAYVFMYLALLGSFMGGPLAWFSHDKPAYDEGKSDGFSVFIVSVAGMFQHRVLFFCLVFAGFWVMFNQVFDLLPNVIDDWVDSSMVIRSVGEAFSIPAVPPVLAGLLALVFGGLCGVGVLLSMRPDRRAAKDVPPAAFIVVGLAAWGALHFGTTAAISGWLGPLAALGGGIAIGGVAFATRLPAKVWAGLLALVGAGASFMAMNQRFAESAQGLIEMADAGANVPPEWMINLNPGLIVFTMVGFAYVSGFMRPLTSIIVGMLVATLGSVLAGTAVVGWITLGGILVFSVGEMLSSPKKMEYLATLAKKGQEGLFMGYANVPGAIGWMTGSAIAGPLYEKHGDKVNLAKRHLTDELGMDAAAVDGLEKTQVLPTLAEKLNMSAPEVQALLFETYHPERIWYVIGAIGLSSVFGMLIYDRVIRKLDGDD